MKKLLFTTLAVIILLTIGGKAEARCGWHNWEYYGPCNKPPVIQNSVLRDKYFKLNIKNDCGRSGKVTVKYQKVGTQRWSTGTWDLSRGENAYVARTTNRHVVISAKLGSFNFPAKKVNMGSTFVEYTYSLTCN